MIVFSAKNRDTGQIIEGPWDFIYRARRYSILNYHIIYSSAVGIFIENNQRLIVRKMIALENLEGLIMLPKSPKYFEVQLHAVYSCFVIQNYSEKKILSKSSKKEENRE